MRACIETAPSQLSDIAILIPVWQPDRQLIGLAQQLLGLGFGAVIIVNDGSDSKYDAVFQLLEEYLSATDFARIQILRHDLNSGKGRALKTGLDYFRQAFPNYTGVVTADADGQHRPEDILKVAEQLILDPSSMVVGSRRFRDGVPARSRVGNVVVRAAFAAITGKSMADTQCGLRGFPAWLIPTVLDVGGERYEYEMNVLTQVVRFAPVSEVEIEAVYIDGNRLSHFRPVLDSMRVLFVLLRFFASSLIGAAIDFAVFAAVFALTSNLLASMAIGRVSSLANFALNRRYVFRSSVSLSRALASYYTLVAIVAVTAYFLISIMVHRLGMNAMAAKFVAETVLWLVSFLVQRRLVFAPVKSRRS